MALSSNHRVQRGNRISCLPYLSVLALWGSFPFVSLTTKCLLTDHSCTRFGIVFHDDEDDAGGNYPYPLMTAAMHLWIVGCLLFFINQLVWLSWKRRERAGVLVLGNEEEGHLLPHAQQQLSLLSLTTTTTTLPSRVHSSVPNHSNRHLLTYYASLGVAIAAKYMVGHVALQWTPDVAIYELFHALNILAIAGLAWLVLGEGLTRGQWWACTGIVAGSLLTAVPSLQTRIVHQGIGQDEDTTTTTNTTSTSTGPILILSLNLLNSLLAGAVVVLLRLSMLKTAENGDRIASPTTPIEGTWQRPYYCRLLRDSTGVVQVTAYKMLFGGIVALPFAMAVEGFHVMTQKQLELLMTSSLVILVYHVTLGVLCGCATASTVGVVEALRPLPALIIIALVQTLPQKTQWFWGGSTILVLSAVMFKLAGATTSSRNIG